MNNFGWKWKFSLIALIIISVFLMFSGFGADSFTKRFSQKSDSLASIEPPSTSGLPPLKYVGWEVCGLQGDTENYTIFGTSCPCPEDPGMASVCGKVRSTVTDESRIETAQFNTIVSTPRPAVSGATVGIYESFEDIPTGQPYGMFERLVSECTTSETDGRYYCPMRRISPLFRNYVVFTCDGEVADIKAVNSAQSIVNLDSDVNCDTNLTPEPLPKGVVENEGSYGGGLEYVSRDEFLGCLSTDEELPNAPIGFEKDEDVYFSTVTGELGGDIRFTPFPPGDEDIGLLSLIVGTHRGAKWEEDCLVTYTGGPKDVKLGKTFEPLANIDPTGQGMSLGMQALAFALKTFLPAPPKYDSIFEKCNYDPLQTNDLGKAMMEDTDERTTPFRYDIPTNPVERHQLRIWEMRLSLQRVSSFPFFAQQYLHSMFGECSMETFTRYAQEFDRDDEVRLEPIDCDIYRQCNDSTENGDRNTLTANSLGAKLQNPVEWVELDFLEEVSKNTVVCKHREYGNIKLGDIQPISLLAENSCSPEQPGCPYKLGSEYFHPTMLLMAGGTRTDRYEEMINDIYVSERRNADWVDWATNSAKNNPFRQGTTVIRESFEERPANSPIRAVRVAKDSRKEGISSVGGTYANVLVNYESGITYAKDSCFLTEMGTPFETEEARLRCLEQHEKDGISGDNHYLYDYGYSNIIWDLNGDVTSLCTVNALREAPGEPDEEGNATTIAPIVIDLADETSMIREGDTNNDKVGDEKTHREDKQSGTATTGSASFSVDRDRDLGTIVAYFFRDVLDSIQRLRSGGPDYMPWGDAGNLAVGIFGTIKASLSGGNQYKSFAERTNHWNPMGFDSAPYATYCIAENAGAGKEAFEDQFPMYDDPDHPGEYPGESDPPGCYPWKALLFQGSCDSYPGTRKQWEGCQEYAAGIEFDQPELNPCPENVAWESVSPYKIRTCRINESLAPDNCEVFIWDKSCAKIEGTDPVEWDCDPHVVREGKQYKRDCTEDDYVKGLMAQYALKPYTDEQEEIIWDKEVSEPPDPTETKPHTSNRKIVIALENADHMAMPGDLQKKSSARTKQSPIWNDTQQASGNEIHLTMNHTVASFTNPTDEIRDQYAGCVGDFQITNDACLTVTSDSTADSVVDNTTACNLQNAIKDDGNKAVHGAMAGQLMRCPEGTGNIIGVQNIVSRPEGSSIFSSDEYPEYEFPACNPLTASRDDWCRAIPPPEEKIKLFDWQTDIDGPQISGGKCNPRAPGTGNCHIWANPAVGLDPDPVVKGRAKEIIMGDLALRIMGAAGKHAGVPGSLLLAVLVNEGHQNTMNWDDDSIARYSSPWWGRLPFGCQDGTYGAMMPFGLIDDWFRASVWGSAKNEDGSYVHPGDSLVDELQGGGYHEKRVNPEGGIIVSQCNFIDAAYAAAWVLRYDGSIQGCSISREDAEFLLTQYGSDSSSGGTAMVPGDYALDVAMNCQ